MVVPGAPLLALCAACMYLLCSIYAFFFLSSQAHFNRVLQSSLVVRGYKTTAINNEQLKGVEMGKRECIEKMINIVFC